ncbi:tetratricopeptide repeat protein [Aporhodopirellula aestuarii]|nr:O-linked GlcNAc transferase [Aporhodopirellula aestuarii]
MNITAFSGRLTRIHQIAASAAKWLVCVLLLTSVTSAVGASDDTGTEPVTTATPPPSMPSDVAGASVPLGGGDFSLRRRSTLDLWRDRDRYRDAVLAAARSEELETAERARWVLGRWQRGILADTPPDLSKQLGTLQPVEAIELLLEEGRFAAATIAMEEATGTLDFASVAARVSMTLDQRFPIYARAAVVNDQTAHLLAFLDVACSTKEMAVCRRDWAKRFPPTLHDRDAKKPDMFSALPPAADAWDPELVSQTECLLHLLDGEIDAAMTIAKRSDHELQQRELASENRGRDPAAGLLSRKQQPLVRVVRMVTSQWIDIAADASSSARAFEQAAEQLAAADANPEGTQRSTNKLQIIRYREEAIRHWSDALIAADRCKNAEVRKAAIAGLLANAVTTTPPIDADVRALIWRTLLIHGEVDAALDVLGDSDPASTSVIAADASRGAEALERLGFPADQIDTQLETWIDSAIDAQRELYEAATSDDPIRLAEAARVSDTGLAPEIETLFTLIRLLDEVSRDDAAWRIADRLSLEDLHAKRVNRSSEYLVRDYVLLALLWTTHSDWMIKLGMRDWETEPSIVSQSLIGRIAVSDEFQLLSLLSHFVRMQTPQASPQETFTIACEIARAEEQDRRNHRQLIAELAQTLRDGSLRQKVNTDPDLEEFFESSPEVWSDLFLAHGRPDLAEPFLQKQAATGDLEATLTLAKEYRLSGTISADVETYEEIWEAVASAHTDGNFRFRDDVMTGVRAVAEQFRLARDRGDSKSADSILEQIVAMACTPSTDMRQQIADVLAECGQWDTANSVYESLLVMTAITSDETQSLIDIARNYQRFATKATAGEVSQTESAMNANTIERLNASDLELRQRAVTWFDIAFAGTLSGVEFRPQLYLVYPRLIAREQLELSIVSMSQSPTAEGRQRANDLLERLHQLDRMDITTAEAILPKMQRIGMQEQVAESIRRMLRVADDHLKTFPADAVTANNVAWGAAMNDIELPQALELARHAVRFEPESAIYRDTLAEILARTGNHAEALQIEKGCLIDDPGQWHLHEQIERFEKKFAKQR